MQHDLTNNAGGMAIYLMVKSPTVLFDFSVGDPAERPGAQVLSLNAAWFDYSFWTRQLLASKMSNDLQIYGTWKLCIY